MESGTARLAACSVFMQAFACVNLGQCPREWLAGPGQGVPGMNQVVRALTTWTPPGQGTEMLVAAGEFTRGRQRCGGRGLPPGTGSTGTPWAAV